LTRLLAGLDFNQPVPMPDFESKEALQAYIGLDIAAERAAKQEFLDEVVPQWLKEGKAREKQKPINTLSGR